MTSPSPVLVLVDGPFVAVGPLIVLYDAECPFCRWAVRRLVRWSRSHRPERPSRSGVAGREKARRPVPVALQRASTDATPLVRTAARRIDLSRELTVVDTATGRAARGGDAILTLVDGLPGGRILRPWWADRPFVRLVRVGYRAVAARRSWLAALGFAAPVDGWTINGDG